MTNEEFFENELKVIKKRAKEDWIFDNIAVNKQGQPEYCRTQPCADCIFNRHCTSVAKRQWLEKEYVKPEQQVDWSKVKVDTPIYVTNSNGNKNEWYPRHFAKFENGTVYAWTDGGTSFTVKSEDDCYEWNYAKLAESED